MGVYMAPFPIQGSFKQSRYKRYLRQEKKKMFTVSHVKALKRFFLCEPTDIEIAQVNSAEPFSKLYWTILITI